MNLGSIFKRDYDINNEVDTLFAELRTIESIKDMVGQQGWQELSVWLIGRISDLSNDILSLSTDVGSNAKEIERKKWSATVYEALINAVGTTLDNEELIKNKLEKLKKVARIAELN